MMWKGGQNAKHETGMEHLHMQTSSFTEFLRNENCIEATTG